MIYGSYFIVSARSLNIALLCLPKAFGRAYSSPWCRKELFFSTSGWFSELWYGGNQEFTFLAVSYLSCWSAVVLRWQDLWKIHKKYTIATINPQLLMSGLSDMGVRCSMDAGGLEYPLMYELRSHDKRICRSSGITAVCTERSTFTFSYRWPGYACQEAEKVANWALHIRVLPEPHWESCWY